MRFEFVGISLSFWGDGAKRRFALTSALWTVSGFVNFAVIGSLASWSSRSGGVSEIRYSSSNSSSSCKATDSIGQPEGSCPPFSSAVSGASHLAMQSHGATHIASSQVSTLRGYSPRSCSCHWISNSVSGGGSPQTFFRWLIVSSHSATVLSRSALGVPTSPMISTGIFIPPSECRHNTEGRERIRLRNPFQPGHYPIRFEWHQG